MEEKEKAAHATNPPENQHKDIDSLGIIQREHEDLPDFSSMADKDGFNPLLDLQREMLPDDSTFGSIRLRTGNRALQDGARLEDPVDLCPETIPGVLPSGEACCLFGDPGAGKTILGVSMAIEIAHKMPTLYYNGELSDKQFQLRYTDPMTKRIMVLPSQFYWATRDPDIAARIIEDGGDPEKTIITDIENAALACGAKVVVIDNLTELCNASEKGDEAGKFMARLLRLKIKYGMTLLVLAHRPKIDPYSPITQNQLAGSKRLMNLFDSSFAIGSSVRGIDYRYIKQVKVRSFGYTYTADHVAVFKLERRDGFMRFTPEGFTTEKEHLKSFDATDSASLSSYAVELHKKGKTVREIASIMGVGKTKVGDMIKAARDAGDLNNEEESTETADDGLLNFS
ncbi:MAG: AAA family ATPase [Bacteroidales bacterium]|nr:AAA family ATPase [Bacteroidales bacterium]